MDKKIYKYISELEDKKEQKKGYFLRYKDNIGVIAELCAIITFIIAIITSLTQLWNSHQEAKFYNINQDYFFQEPIAIILFNVTSKVILRFVSIFFPILAFYFIKLCKNSSSNISINTQENNKNLENYIVQKIIPLVMHAIFFLSYCIYFPVLFEEECYLLFSWFPAWSSPIFFLILAILNALYVLLLLYYKSKNKTYIVLGILGRIMYVFYMMYYHFSCESPTTPKECAEIILFGLLSGYYLWVQLVLSLETEARYYWSIRIVCLLMLCLIPICFSNFFILTYKGTSQKNKTYEIVQNNNYPELTDKSGQITSASNIQVVILHRGSQILLMNGTINDGEVEIKSPKDITSSSNLYLDISSYEIHDADKYIFYRKRFASVKRKYGDYLLDKDDEEKK